MQSVPTVQLNRVVSSKMIEDNIKKQNCLISFYISYYILTYNIEIYIMNI